MIDNHCDQDLKFEPTKVARNFVYKLVLFFSEIALHFTESGVVLLFVNVVH